MASLTRQDNSRLQRTTKTKSKMQVLFRRQTSGNHTRIMATPSDEFCVVFVSRHSLLLPLHENSNEIIKLLIKYSPEYK